MICPECKSELKPWPWYDGGYKGIKCSNCNGKWWSAEFEAKAARAAMLAVDELVASMDFPTDATSEEQEK